MSKILIVLMTLFSFHSFALEYGIDRLGEPAVAQLLQGKTLAVLTHAAGRNKAGVHLIDLLFKQQHLVKIFAPEHGLRTLEDDWVGDGVDEATGLPVISLYKEGGRKPRAQDLQGLEAIVIDLQDVGVRYYTYFSTIAEVMKASAPLNIEVIILDRPNIQGGDILEGQLLDPSLAGRFTSFHTVPTRHGMTLGELAMMVNAELKMGVKLSVVTATGWHRERLVPGFDRTWVAPSPALETSEQAGLYALWGNLESVDLTVGRGKTNERAFRVLGAPWMSEAAAQGLAEALTKLNFPGLSFRASSWLVTRSKFSGKQVNGVVLAWDGTPVRSDEFSYRLAGLLLKHFPKHIDVSQFATASFGGKTLIHALEQGKPWESQRLAIDQGIEAFRLRRLPYLLYR